MGYRITVTETTTTTRISHARSQDPRYFYLEEMAYGTETDHYRDSMGRDITTVTTVEQCPHDCGYSEEIRGGGGPRANEESFSPFCFVRYVCEDCGDVYAHGIEWWTYADVPRWRKSADGRTQREARSHIPTDEEMESYDSIPDTVSHI